MHANPRFTRHAARNGAGSGRQHDAIHRSLSGQALGAQTTQVADDGTVTVDYNPAEIHKATGIKPFAAPLWALVVKP
jgi:hypothetical protein